MDSGFLISAGSQGFREGQPAFPLDPNRQGSLYLNPVLPSQDSVLREYLRVLIKRKWVVLGSLAVIFGAVTISHAEVNPHL